MPGTENLVGQLFVFGYPGPKPSEQLLRWIQEKNLGGVILFARNVASLERIAAAIRQLQSRATSPLFIMIDQEGGATNRIKENFPTFPSNRSFGSRRDVEGIANAYGTTARHLKQIGVNVNLVPVVDVVTNPENKLLSERSFGSDVFLVVNCAAKAVQAIQAEGVLACAKHFPGLGDVAIDPHRELPTNPNPVERFETIDFPPFRAAIEAGVASVMTTHLLCPALDPDHATTTSEIIVEKFLRDRLGFSGLVLSDDMEMGAIARTGDVPRACLEAFLAGHDQILICHSAEIQEQTLALFTKELKKNSQMQKRFAESLERIQTTKRKWLQHAPA